MSANRDASVVVVHRPQRAPSSGVPVAYSVEVVPSATEPGWEEVNVVGVTARPTHAAYATLASRVQSYETWPHETREQQPQQLAEAGFFYAGIQDNVKCFFCSGGLRNWEPHDDVWVEHARWFPRCGFLHICKGEDFVAAVQAKYPKSSQMVGERGYGARR
ncbi:PREDICTED: putative inhibitor of apoptosis [Priapulus caudatus]|uniref:Inhibitor of apoptosis n=1 Tax=Priapulus caudatus TaxID=37621 RepID=A0ABM1F3X2_PRICU|nr:PREDICTED: putative inhibitor of apoptosis [Priapulus caudatus]